MILTTKSGVRIDVEAFVNTGHCYDIKCEVCCEDAILNLPQPENIEVVRMHSEDMRFTVIGLQDLLMHTMLKFRNGLMQQKKEEWMGQQLGWICRTGYCKSCF